MSDIKVKELEAAIEEAFEKREAYDEAKRKSTEAYNEYTKLQGKVQGMLEELEMDSYKSKAGSFSYRMEEPFKVPKGLDNRRKFFDYLKQRGVYETMVTVNSRTLNAFAKAEAEASSDLDFNIPGLEKSDPRPVVTMRRAK